MGSGSSRLGTSSSPSPPRTSTTKVNRTKQRLASFICGSSSSSSSSQREDCAAESPVNSTGNCLEVTNKLSTPTNESTLTSKGGTGLTSRSSPRSEPGGSSAISATSSEHTSVEDESQIESISNRRCSPENDEVVHLPHINAANEHYQQRLVDTANESCKGKIQPVEFSCKKVTTSDFHDPVGNDMSQASSDVIFPTPSSMLHNEIERPPTSFEEINDAPEIHDSGTGQISVASDPVSALQSQNDESIQEVVPAGLGLLVPDRVQARPEGSVLHVDVVSISSNNLPNVNNEISTREARRNSRRMFWDAFSSRSSRRHTEFPAILFTSGDADSMGSRRRWILDLGDDLLDDGVDVESWHFDRRSRATNEHRQNSRSEFWDRLRGAASHSNRRTTCPYDLHPDGSCSCELDEEAGFLTSISRIVLLAEALFEVLDEIHRQPDSFSLSMLSVPAPESVVDALPIRTYEKRNSAEADHGDDVDQCYICLVEYEEGDKIRVLPCHHEYHMSCVDRWLKEVHGVCPLCRGDVRGEAVGEGSASSSSDAHLT